VASIATGLRSVAVELDLLDSQAVDRGDQGKAQLQRLIDAQSNRHRGQPPSAISKSLEAWSGAITSKADEGSSVAVART
jgi:hypothetical protein